MAFKLFGKTYGRESESDVSKQLLEQISIELGVLKNSISEEGDEVKDTTKYGNPELDSAESIDSIKGKLWRAHLWKIRAMEDDSDSALDACKYYEKVLENAKGWLARNCDGQTKLVVLLECGVNIYGTGNAKCAWKSGGGYVVGNGSNTNIIGRFDTPKEAVAALR